VAETRLVAPEAELGTGPYVIGWLNELSEAVRGTKWKAECTYSAHDALNATDVISELDMLLTSGRLNAHSKSVITSRYVEALTSSTPRAALQYALELMLFTSEFHATNLAKRREVAREVAPSTPSQGRACARLPMQQAHEIAALCKDLPRLIPWPSISLRRQSHRLPVPGGRGRHIQSPRTDWKLQCARRVRTVRLD
jgi:hypothetical protein